jgi:hypothetical protein
MNLKIVTNDGRLEEVYLTQDYIYYAYPCGDTLMVDKIYDPSYFWKPIAQSLIIDPTRG